MEQHTSIEMRPTAGYQLERIPPPSYRHAAPSAPWPWVDIRDEVDQASAQSEEDPVPKGCDHTTCEGRCWKAYPQSRFPNWTPKQVKKCKIQDAIEDYDRKKPCVIYKLDVHPDGTFHDAGVMRVTSADDDLDDQWGRFIADKRGEGIRVRALFVEHMTGPALRMLGGKYDIEPFFFSSSLNWIPSYFQEDLKQGEGDHITITLPFIQSLPGDAVPPVRPGAPSLAEGGRNFANQTIDTQAPLRLKSEKENRALVLDLLSAHLVRNKAGNTIVSFHPNIDLPTTNAKYFHRRICFAGKSVYWQKMLQKTDDPTFLLLLFVWHAMYAWDEALQHLYEHICDRETEVIKMVLDTAKLHLTEELHIIRAHLLHYSSLLNAFEKVVEFIQETPNPALTDPQGESKRLMERECKTLLAEIKRLDREREMQERRLKNVMDLVFSSVNIMDSKTMQRMTEAAVRDSAAMKQIAYLTMVFLPASFVAAIFGMNVREINPSSYGTVPHYVIITFALTAATVWIIVAFQSRYLFEPDFPFWKRLGWPVLLPYYRYRGSNEKNNDPEKAMRSGDGLYNGTYGEVGQPTRNEPDRQTRN